jgi:hypothetical protein
VRTSIKDIVQPKKRGVKIGTNRFALTSYTIANIFFVHLKGYSHALNLKNRFQRLGPKKGGVFFDVDSAIKKNRGALRHCATYIGSDIKSRITCLAPSPPPRKEDDQH